MESKDMNLNEIHKLSESEFRKHFAQWVEEDGVARALQAKLRKDLIETFNKTHLEVPFRNTLPDFDSETPFRFTKGDIKEIFEAISIDVTEEFQEVIVDYYLNKTTPKGCLSLLYLIFKYMSNSQKVENMHAKSAAKPSEPETGRSEYSKDKSNSESPQHKDEKSSDRNPKQQQLNSLYDNQFRYLNRYLIILSRKVKEMSNSLEQLEKRETDCNRLQRKSFQTRRIEHLNRSLDKISENLRVLSVSKRKNRKMAIIVSSIDKLAQQLEQCSENFQTMSRSMRNSQLLNKEKSSCSAEKSYNDWIKELISTKSGKKFVAKIEIALRQTLEEEKEKLAQAFEKKLENHKSLIKLKYKQKLLQRLEVQPSKNSQDDKDKGVAVQNYIDKKLDEISKKHDDLLKKIQRREGSLKREELRNEIILRTEDEHLNEEKVVSVRRKLFDEMSQDENILLREKQSGIIQRKTKDVQTDPQEKKSVDLKFQLEEMARSIAEQEHNIDEIIYGAKLRVQELEYESNQLDRSFQDYIEKQRAQKSQQNANTAHIWNSYTLQKSLLEHPNIKHRTSIKNTKLIDIGNIVLDKPSIENTSTPAASSVNETPQQIASPAFENPFRKLKKDVFEKEPWIIGNPLFKETTAKRSENFERRKLCNESESQIDMQHNIESKETNNRYLEANVESEVHLTPVSSEIHLPDTTLEGIVLSDTKSSEKSENLSSKNISIALKVPNMNLSRSDAVAPESSPEISESTSNRLDISTGKQGSSENDFWD